MKQILLIILGTLDIIYLAIAEVISCVKEEYARGFKDATKRLEERVNPCGLFNAQGGRLYCAGYMSGVKKYNEKNKGKWNRQNFHR